jgi:hypothetical protein
MHRAAQCLLGTHDFHSFETEWPNRSSSVRTVSHVAVCRAAGAEIFSTHAIRQTPSCEPDRRDDSDAAPFVCLEVESDGFLYKGSPRCSDSAEHQQQQCPQKRPDESAEDKGFCESGKSSDLDFEQQFLPDIQRCGPKAPEEALRLDRFHEPYASYEDNNKREADGDETNSRKHTEASSEDHPKQQPTNDPFSTRRNFIDAYTSGWCINVRNVAQHAPRKWIPNHPKRDPHAGTQHRTPKQEVDGLVDQLVTTNAIDEPADAKNHGR